MKALKSTHNNLNINLTILLASLIASPASAQSTIDPAIGRAVIIQSSMRCNLPAGIPEFKPILGINPDDPERETLAREMIEIRRREKLTEGNWQLAAMQFHFDQVDLNRILVSLNEDRQRVEVWISNARAGRNPFTVPIDQPVKEQAMLFQRSCDELIKLSKRLADLQDRTQLLKKEKNKPWLSSKKRLTCAVLNTTGCMK